MMNIKKLNQGFTLIELIIVIVVLGVLAAVAAPRFLDLSSDARAAIINNIAGSLQSQYNIVIAKSKIPNNILTTGAQPVIDINGNGIADIEANLQTRGSLINNTGPDIMMIRRGTALNIDNHQIHKLVDLPEDILAIARSDGQNTDIGFDLNGDGEVRDDNCRVFYSQNSTLINPVTTGC